VTYINVIIDKECFSFGHQSPSLFTREHKKKRKEWKKRGKCYPHDRRLNANVFSVRREHNILHAALLKSGNVDGCLQACFG